MINQLIYRIFLYIRFKINNILKSYLKKKSEKNHSGFYFGFFKNGQ